MKNAGPVVRPPLPDGIKLEENVYVTMRDGVKIAVDIYRPEAEGTYPAILSISPYIKEIQQYSPHLSHSIEAGATDFFVSKGYVHVIASVRGTGFSQGQYNFFATEEQRDGYDLVEWIAKQPWCNENVGMLGDSYFAMSQYYTAAQQPPHLKCIVPVDGGTDLYRDFAYPGGTFKSSFIGMWGVDTIQQCLWPGPVEGKLPPANFINELSANPADGPYYWERSAYIKLDRINVPVLNIVGHSPGHVRGQLGAYSNLKSINKLIVLPRASPPPYGGVHVFFILSKPMNEHILKWFDHWLKGIDNGITKEPPIVICDSGTQQWRYENEYPLARTQWTKFYFRSNPVGPATRPPYGLISEEAPIENEEPDAYGTPECLRLIADGKPVLAYGTPPLTNDIRIWGPFSVVLYGSSTTRDTTWFVKVADMAPDGKSIPLSFANLKASFREVDESRSKPGRPFHQFRNPVPPEPNRIYEYQIEMLPIFHTFKAGHRIAVQIASEDFRYHSTLHTLYTAEMLPTPAKNTIYHDSEHPSHLLLPVIPEAHEIKPVEPSISEIRWEFELK